MIHKERYNMQKNNEVFGTPIHVHTRRQAIEDGELIDVSDTALKIGFKVPVAITRAVWYQCVEWTAEDSDKQTSQDQLGRLQDVLWMLYWACQRIRDAESCIQYQLNVVLRDGSSTEATLTQLKAMIGGDDNGKRAITIMFPNED